MANRATVLLSALMLCASAVEAKDMADFYSTQELESWHYILELQTHRNFEMLRSQILASSSLTTEQRKRAIAARLALPLPLRGPNNDLMEYYAQGNTIVVPVLSLKFLTDVLMANAWLYSHGYDPRTVDEYVSVLKYRDAVDFPLGQYPRPFATLGIPNSDAEAIDQGKGDPDVQNAFFGTMLVASGFIMAHELGHVVLGHTPARRSLTLEQRLHMEEDADDFALRTLSRIRPDVDAMIMFFVLTSAWYPTVADFSSKAEYEKNLRLYSDHPITGERIRTLGKKVYDNPEMFLAREELKGEMADYQPPTPENIARRKRFGTKVIQLGNLIDDEAYQRNLARRGAYARLDTLDRRPISPVK